MVGKSVGECFDRKCYDIFNTPMCRTDSCTCKLAIGRNSANHGETRLHLGEHEIPIEFTSRPLRNHEGKVIGCVENFIDISERLEQEKIILEQKEKLLRKREDDIRHLQDEILELSTPVIEVWKGVLTMPLIGTLDSHRAHIAMERVLESIDQYRASFVIIDITGVPIVDAEVAGHILKTASAARLMGTDTMLTGVRPHTARVIGDSGVSLENIILRGHMIEALHYAITQLEERKTRMKNISDLISSREIKDTDV